jgi:hypothetical protein
MSLTVIRPLSSKASFTTRIRSSLCLFSSALASAGLVPSFSLTVISFSRGVMIWLTLTS